MTNNIHGSFFPLLIQYEKGDVVVVYHSTEIRSGISFKVLKTNYTEDK